MDSELIMKATMLKNETDELESRLEAIDSEISDLEQFFISISFLNKNGGKDFLASLGKGVFLKSSIQEKNLLVSVGSGVVLEKSPQEIESLVKSQVHHLKEARLSLLGALDSSRTELLSLIKKIEKDTD